VKRIVVIAVGGALVATAVFVTVSLTRPEPLRVGAIYPLSGSQGPGGVEEYRGVRLATDLVNEAGGVHGQQVQLVPVDAAGSDAAAASVDLLASKEIRFVLGSYGTTISVPAAAEAARKKMLFWETGAVGSMAVPDAGAGRSFFRVAPSGVVLGSSAILFVAHQLAPKLHRSASSLRYAVANVDDAYGSSVARGAVAEIRALHLPFAGQFPYDPLHLDAPALVKRFAAAHPDVLFVAAYMQDGVAVRREMVRQKLHLLVNIGSSSSYCMPDFGKTLGADAVGLFASDKPDEGSLDPRGLAPNAAALSARAGKIYLARYHQNMSAPALAGFSAAWALFHDVMPHAGALTPRSVAEAALRVRIPSGGLPNGSGLQFAGPRSPDAGANLRAVSVIWEWTSLAWRAVVWPPRFATEPVRAIRIL